MEKTIHQGRNVKRFREMLGIKQEALAFELGDDWSQKKVSLLEQKEKVDDKLLEEISKVLNIPAAAFRDFDEEHVITNISCNFHDSPNSGSVNYNFNPIEKMLELTERNKDLYERLLAAEKEKVVLLERMLGER